MTIPRSQQINLDSTPYYHVMARCVRRSHLCGVDDYTQKDYSHRKQWMLDRMKHLVDIFSIKISAYAIMSNHYHLVLFVDQNTAQKWTDDEVKARSARLYAQEVQRLATLEQCAGTTKIVQDTIDKWRERLTDISWFMRCLNEPLARMSNKEDKVTGRFWEGRYKSQALLDEGAVLSAMVYVDLNPVRAAIANTPEESEFTSIYDRIKAINEAKPKSKPKNKQKSAKKATTTKYVDIPAICDSPTQRQPDFLMPIQTLNENDIDNPEVTIDFKLSDYLHLVDFTGQHAREDKRGAIPDSLLPILERVKLSKNEWFNLTKGLEKGFGYAVGSIEKLALFNNSNRQGGLKGMSSAKRYYSTELIA